MGAIPVLARTEENFLITTVTIAPCLSLIAFIESDA
jgi:hypothetical protein